MKSTPDIPNETTLNQIPIREFNYSGAEKKNKESQINYVYIRLLTSHPELLGEGYRT